MASDSAVPMQRHGASVSDLTLGGMTPLTTVDYPGELAAVMFCQGCPWRCSYCHNPHLQGRRVATAVPWGQAVRFLERRRGLLDAVIFSGGEPTLQHGLRRAVTDARRLGFKVGLHTAGCYPDRLARLLPNLDWVGLDIKAQAADYPALTGVPDSGVRAFASLDRVLASGCPCEVRITVDETYLTRPRLQGLIGQVAAAGAEHIVLQRCRIGGSRPGPDWLPGSRVRVCPATGDWIALD